MTFVRSQDFFYFDFNISRKLSLKAEKPHLASEMDRIPVQEIHCFQNVICKINC